jgi:hypothetical protein
MTNNVAEGGGGGGGGPGGTGGNAVQVGARIFPPGHGGAGGVGAAGGSGQGGGLYLSGAALTLTGATIATDSAAGGVGGAGGQGGFGGIGFRTGGNGGNGANGGNGGSGQGGGLYASAAPLTLTRTTVSHDTATGGSGGGGGAGGPGGRGSSDGQTGSPGGAGVGGAGQGGGILDGGTLTLTNSTIANNSATARGGGISGSVTAVNDTIAYNTVGSGGSGGGLAGTATLDNTIVALNTNGTGSGAPADDISGTVSSSSAYNLIGTGGSGGLTNGVNHNQVGVANPGLGPLADNGGSTQTIALLTGSPALDKGSNALAVDPSTRLPLIADQRGGGFPRIINHTVDIGAYEFFQGANVVGISAGWGTQTAPLQTAADLLRLLPAGRKTDLPWLGINRLPITLSEAETLTSGDVTVTSARGIKYGPVTISGSGTSYTITLANPITVADRLTITIGNANIATYTWRLDVLPGDFNDDGVVNSQDIVGVRNEILGLAPITIFGDINGDGKVDINDYNAVRAKIGTTLPPTS